MLQLGELAEFRGDAPADRVGADEAASAHATGWQSLPLVREVVKGASSQMGQARLGKGVHVQVAQVGEIAELQGYGPADRVVIERAASTARNRVAITPLGAQGSEQPDGQRCARTGTPATW